MRRGSKVKSRFFIVSDFMKSISMRRAALACSSLAWEPSYRKPRLSVKLYCWPGWYWGMYRLFDCGLA